MGRSLYLDDERQDVQEMIFFAFCNARHGTWGEAAWAFEEARDMLRELQWLTQEVDHGNLDANVIEGLKPPTSKGTGDWISTADLLTEYVD